MNSQLGLEFRVNQETQNIREERPHPFSRPQVPNPWRSYSEQTFPRPYPWGNGGIGLGVTGIDPRLLENAVPTNSEQRWEGEQVGGLTEQGWSGRDREWPAQIYDSKAENHSGNLLVYSPEQVEHEFFPPADWDIPVFPLSSYLNKKVEESIRSTDAPGAAIHSKSTGNVTELCSSPQQPSPTSLGDTFHSPFQSSISSIGSRMTTESPDLSVIDDNSSGLLATRPR